MYQLGFLATQELCLYGGIVPSDFSIRTVGLWHVPYCAHRRQYMKTAYVAWQYRKILLSRVVSRGPLSERNQKSFSNASPKWRSEEPVVILTHVAFGTCPWCAAFAYLARASLTPSSWCPSIQWPVWALFWRGARARALGHRSWNVRARPHDSAGSSTWGSSGAISARRWSAG